jgi:hypothetical protein
VLTVVFCNDVASIYVIFRRQAGALGGQHCGPCVTRRSRGEGINNKEVPGRTHKAYFITAEASASAHTVLMLYSGNVCNATINSNPLNLGADGHRMDSYSNHYY